MHVCLLRTPCGDSFGSLIVGSVEEQRGETDSGCSQPMHIHPYICSPPNTHTHTHAAATSLHAVCLKESSLDSIQDKRGEMRTRGEKNHSSCTTLVSLSMQKPLRSLWSSVWRNNVAFDVGLQYRTGASLRPQLNPYKNVLRNYKTHRGDH